MAARFRPEDRIRKQSDFDRIYKARIYAADDMIIINGHANGLEHSRLGLSVSRKVGNAVVRNRWKRLIREAFRLSREGLPLGIDFVVRPQKEAKPEFQAIAKSLASLTQRIARRVQKGKTEVRGQRSEVSDQAK